MLTKKAFEIKIYYNNVNTLRYYYDKEQIVGITIKDIATIAGVSTSTVSLVMSGKGYVSNKTKIGRAHV